MRKIFVVLVLILLVVTFSCAVLKDKPAVVPFTTNEDGLVIIPASFGRSITGHVILDTGAGVDVLSPRLVQKLRGKPRGQFTGFRMNGEHLDLPLYTIAEVSVGHAVLKDVVAATWDVLDTDSFKGVEGIVSLNDFRHRPFTLDFGRKLFVLETRESLAQRRKIGTTIPLKFDDQRGISLDSFAEFAFGDQSGECDIDTGSPSATLSMRYMQPLGIATDGKDVQKRESQNLAGATVVRYDARVPQIALLTAPKISIVQPDVSFSTIIYDCVVGVDFWTGKTLTYNLAEKQLIVSN
jgi:Aspartyl protease